MVGCGVEATGGADEFASQSHAGEHFAPGCGVVAGSGQDVRDALRGRVVAQEVEDGLTVRGMQGSGRETGKVGAVSFGEPVESWNTIVRVDEVAGEDGRLLTEGMPDGNEEMVALAGGIGSE